MTFRRHCCWLVPVVLFSTSLPAQAHDGPPFPILVDEKAGPYVVSVWGDPDVGTGTFWVFLKQGAGEEDVSEDTTVEVHVRPLSKRLPEVGHSAQRQVLRQRVQYYAEIPFDAEELWSIRFHIRGPEGTAELAAEVEVTPPGYGRWDLLIYLFPFVLLAALWTYGVLRHGRRHRPDGAPADGKTGDTAPGAEAIDSGTDGRGSGNEDEVKRGEESDSSRSLARQER